MITKVSAKIEIKLGLDSKRESGTVVSLGSEAFLKSL